MPTELPDNLRYLESALDELAKVPEDELNEDVDLSTLEAALRDRVRGLSIREAQERIHEDRRALESWVKGSGTESRCGAWVVGFLSYRTGALARRLVSPPQAEPKGPAIVFEPPEGWCVDRVPCSLHLRKGRRKMGAIIAIDGSSLAAMLHQNDVRDEIQSRNRNPLGVVGSWTKSPVQFRAVRGHKYLYTQTTPAPWKRIQYLLEAPGGAVNIVLDAGGKDIDESEFEGKLQTLRLTPGG